MSWSLIHWFKSISGAHIFMKRLKVKSTRATPYRVIIASANPIFREGLRKNYAAHWGRKAVVVGLPSTLADTLIALERLEPDLVVVDHDDSAINHSEFLIGFLSGRQPMQVALVSLESSESVIVYRRQNLTTTQAVTWLNDPWD